MATEPVDGILHIVTNDAPIAGTMYGAQTGALTGQFSVWMAIPQHHDRITVMNAQAPKTYYLMDENAYTFKVRADDGKGVDVEYVFTLTASGTYTYGNYSTLDFLTALNDSACWTRNGVSGTSPGTWSLGTYNRRFTLTFTGSDSILKTTQGIYNLSTHMGRYLGFAVQTAPYNSGFGVTLLAPYVVNFTYTNVIHICCDVGQEDVPASKGNCIGRIYMTDTSFGAFATLFNPNPYETSRRLQTRELGVYRGMGTAYRLVTFTMVDDDGHTINFNGAHIVMGIYTYARASLYELVRRSANSFAEVAQEQRHVNLSQLEATKRLRDAVAKNTGI